MWMEGFDMSATGKVALYALAGAFARVIIKGDWRWRAFIMAAASVVVAVPLAAITIYALPFYQGAPEIVHGSTYTLFGVVALSIFERIETLHVSIKTPFVDAESEGNDEKEKLP